MHSPLRRKCPHKVTVEANGLNLRERIDIMNEALVKALEGTKLKAVIKADYINGHLEFIVSGEPGDIAALSNVKVTIEPLQRRAA